MCFISPINQCYFIRESTYGSWYSECHDWICVIIFILRIYFEPVSHLRCKHRLIGNLFVISVFKFSMLFFFPF